MNSSGFRKAYSMIKSWENRFFYVPQTSYNVLLALGNEAPPECLGMGTLHIEQANSGCSYLPLRAHITVLSESLFASLTWELKFKQAMDSPPTHSFLGAEYFRGSYLHVGGILKVKFDNGDSCFSGILHL